MRGECERRTQLKGAAGEARRAQRGGGRAEWFVGDERKGDAGGGVCGEA